MEDNHINYRGYEILKKDYHEMRQDYMTIDSNEFELDENDLERLLCKLNEMADNLKNNNVNFKDLKYHFYAIEDHSDDDYYPEDAKCEISFTYKVLESDDESVARIERKKKEIDELIERKKREKEAQDMVDNYLVDEAMRLLRSKGYNITKDTIK